MYDFYFPEFCFITHEMQNILHFPSHDTWFSKTKVKQIVMVTISKVLWALHFIGGGTRKTFSQLKFWVVWLPTEQKATLS